VINLKHSQSHMCPRRKTIKQSCTVGKFRRFLHIDRHINNTAADRGYSDEST